MSRRRHTLSLPLVAALSLAAPLGGVSAQSDGFDEPLVALTYHKLSGEPLDLAAVAERSPAVQRATQFDRPDVLKAEIARLESELAAAEPKREFFVRVSDNISQYDHERGEFSVMLFQPGFYVQLQAFGQEYRLVFANGDGARAIPMPKEEARLFDQQLSAMGRAVTNEIRFRVIGKGDPAGGVTGARVIRAEILASRLLDRDGRVVFTPRITAPVTAAAAAESFDVATADVSGFHVGVKAKDLETTLRRLFGPVSRRARDRGWHPGYAAGLFVNEMGCMALDWKGQKAVPGSVCVTAFVDRSDVVRAIRIERVFPWMQADVFRATLVRKYGPVADAKQGSGYALGWGPQVDPALVYDRSGPATAVAAYYMPESDFIGRSGNALPMIRVVLQLVDAKWASSPSL
jgi:hypothetical protein